jgi:HK97 family phage portal protein
VFKGMKNSGKTAILDDQFEIKELGFNPKDLAFQEGKKYLRTTITNAFGVHENFVSVENANRASSETAIEQYYRFTILPKLRRFQEVINQNLLTKYDDNLWMCFDDPTPENADSIMKKDANDISLGIMSINEKRLERGLEVWDEKYDRPIDNNKTNKTNVTNITEDTDIIEG